MLYFFALASIILTSFSANADCLNEIVERKFGQNVNTKQIECISQSHGVQQSLSTLCSSDQKDLSPLYQAYQSYEIAHEKAFYEVQAATNPSSRSQAQLKMRQIDRDWEILGYKGEVARLLEPFWSAKFSCAE